MSCCWDAATFAMFCSPSTPIKISVSEHPDLNSARLLTPCVARQTDVTCCDIEAATIGMESVLGIDLVSHETDNLCVSA